MDETTILGTTKSCAVIVEFFTMLLDLVDVRGNKNVAGGSTGKNLYMYTFEVHDISVNNFIGFAADDI